jgi:predicted O-methyltransferase YrrM
LNRQLKVVNATVHRIIFGLKHPEVAARYLLLGKEGFTCSQIWRLTGLNKSTVEEVYAEILKESEFEGHIQKMLAGRYCGQISFTVGRLLYTVCRLLQPRIVVETGVAAGVSSAFILKALKDNADGTLHSIDRPNYAEMGLPKSERTGFVIPDAFRAKWKLHLGLSSRILPGLLSELQQIDIFIHDSGHTYENMLFEYETAWSSLRSGGVLLSDDVNWNAAFHDFSSHVKRRSRYLYGRGFAGLRK